MSKSSCSVGRQLILVLALIFLTAASSQAQHPTRSHAKTKMALAADITFRAGVHASLPPHLSTLLGLAKEKECAVVQNVARTRQQVQGFNVSLRARHDVVLFVVDETTHDQIFYLTSPEGTLRKVVSVKAGVGQVERLTDEARKSFQKEKQFWVDRLVPSGPAM